MDDFVVNVRQIAQYPQATAAATDAILLQQGGIGGAYAWTNPAGLVAPAIAASITTAAINLSDASWIAWGTGARLQANAGTGLSFTIGTAVPFSVDAAGNVNVAGKVTVAQQGTLEPNDLATAQYVTDNTVWSFNGRKGNITLQQFDIRNAGGAPINSPVFTGIPTSPAIPNHDQYDFQIATTQFVQDVVNCRIQQLLMAHPFVWTFNGRIGDIVLTVDDVNAALLAPGAQPMANTPTMADFSTRIATTQWVTWQTDQINSDIAVLRSQITSDIDDSQYATLTYVQQNYAPLDSAVLVGTPSAPTAAVGTTTGQIATTAFVMHAVAASVTGVVSFNTRSGNVVLNSSDITAASGALIASPAFTGVPLAPTAAIGTNSTQLATCAFVMNEVAAISAGVVTFNNRSGAVNLLLSDVTAVGGAPIAAPNFSGVPTAATAAPGTSTTQLATCAFVTAAVAASAGVTSFNTRTGAITLNSSDISAAGGAPSVSPSFTGTPLAPTAVVGTSSTQIATTAFVAAAIAATTGVATFNGRSGAVTLTLADVTGVGGAPLSATVVRNLLTNLTLSPSATTPSTVLSVAGGVACSDDFSTMMLLPAAMSKNLSAAWAAGSGNGGLDTGSALVASSTYAVFLIKRPDTGVVDVLVSLSVTSPALPANYTLKRRLGAFMTTSAALIYPFIQNGDYFWIPAITVYSASVTTAETPYAFPGPLAVSFQPLVLIAISATSSTATVALKSAYPIGGVEVPSNFNSPFYVQNGNAAVVIQQTSAVAPPTNTNAQLYISTTISGPTGSVSIYAQGWIDYRTK